MELALAARPARIIALVDQSSSMSAALIWDPGHSRWQEAAAGVEHLANEAASRGFELGLDGFPDGSLDYFEDCHDECCADPACMMSQYARCTALSIRCDRNCTVDLPPIIPLAEADVSGPQMIDYMSLAYLPGIYTHTPLVEQLGYYLEDRSAEMPGFYAGDGRSFLVLITDGEDSCFDTSETPDIPAIVAELARLASALVDTRGIRLVPIGIGENTGNMADELDAIAAHGGTGYTSFFPVDQDGQLEAVLSVIAESFTSCVFDADPPDGIADPETVRIELGGVEQAFDPGCADGWRWAADSTPEAPRIELCGAACQAVKGGQVELSGRSGC
ncbi:MAG: hypothetical protein JXR96_22415 [Deltaproteobacteria bacterium]|nr:hypothetical protein [Deltaproteobacteria bacterium]